MYFKRNLKFAIMKIVNKMVFIKCKPIIALIYLVFYFFDCFKVFITF
jgi:hypothetical protein